MLRILLFGLLFVTIIGLVQPSRALAQIFWNLPNATGNWLVPGNWSPAIVPSDASNYVVIGKNGTATLSSSETIGGLILGDGSDPANTPGGLILSGGARLTMATTTNYVIIGQGNPGTMTVTGPGTNLTDNGVALFVGNGATGTLSVLSSATVNIDNALIIAAAGTLTINGAGQSTTTTVTVSGNGTYVGTGTLNILNGGAFSASAGTMYVGYNGTGILSVTSGATMNLGALQVGTNSTGTVTVDGTGGSTPAVTVTGFTSIATNGPGTLSIFNGAIFNAGGPINLYGSGGNASLNVSGAGAKLNISGVTSYLQIGLAADNTNSASAIIQNGGNINFDPTAQGPFGTALYVGGTSNGSLTIGGGTGTASSVTVSHDVVIGRNYSGTGSVGTLSLLNGGTFAISGTPKIYLGGSLDGETFHGGTAIINFGSTTGTTGVAATSGTLSFSGNMYLEGNSQINFNNTGTTTLSANILADFAGATMALSKVGSGTAILSGNNNYAGSTTVSVGTLQAGSTTGFSANSDFTVNSTLDLHGFSSAVGSLAGSGIVNSSVAGAVTLTAGGDNATTAFSGVLQNGSGTLVLTKTGTGTLTLSGSNTYTGGTTISVGTLQLGNATAIGSIVGNITDNGVLRFNRNDIALSLSGNISGTGSVVQAGTGTSTLSGTNTYSGGTSISGGILSVAAGTNLGSGGISISNNARLLSTGAAFSSPQTLTLGTGGGTVASATGTTATYSGAISGSTAFNVGDTTNTGTVILTAANTYTGGTTISGGTLQIGNGGTTGSIIGGVADTGVLAFDRSNSLTFAGIISGTGNLVQLGGGILTLTGTNVYSGTTLVSAGTLQAGSATSLSPNSAFTVNSVLDLHGNLNTIGSLAGGGTVTNTGAAATLTAGNTLDTTFSGTLLDGSVADTLALTKTGTGTLTLSGNNPYSGATTVSVGTLKAGSTTALSATSNFTVNSILDLNGFSNAIGSLAGNSTGIVTNHGATPATLTAGGTNATTTTFSGVLQDGTGTLALTKSGTGTLILSGTSTYSGLTDVQSGQLSVQGTLTSSAVQVENGATLGGAGTINGAVTVLSVGKLAPGNNAAGTLTVGSLVLSAGSFSNFELGPAGVVGGTSNDLVHVNGSLTLAGTLNITDLGSFGTGVYQLFHYGTETGSTLTIGNIPSGVTRGALSIQIVANQVNLVVNGANLLEYWDGSDAANNSIVGGGNGTWNTTNTNWTVADGSSNSAWKQGTAVFGGTAGTVTLTESVTVAGLQFVTTGYLITTSNGSAITAESGTILEAGTGVIATIGVPIVGTGDVTKTDAGTVTLTGTNTYSGGTGITGGILSVAAGTNLGSGGISISNNAELLTTGATFSSPQTLLLGTGGGTVASAPGTTATYSGAISGSTAFNVGDTANTGTVILTAANTYTGGTTISGGTLQIGNAGTTGSIIGGVADTGVLAFDHSNSLTFAGIISGTGNLVQLGGGILTLTGTNVYSGTTLVSAGTLQAGSAASLSPNSAFTVNSILDLNSNANVIGSLAGSGTVTNNGATPAILTSGNDGTSTIFSGTLANGSSSLGLTKTGAGTLTLSGTNTYSGATALNGGMLQAGSTTALSPNSAFIVNSVLDLDGHLNGVGSLSGNSTGIVTNHGATPATLTAGGNNSSTTFSGVLQDGTGTLALTKSGTGTLILSGTSTCSGLTDVQGGQLSVQGALTSSAVQVENGATLGGAGTISGAVTVLSGGNLSPGNNAAGTLTVGSLVLSAGSVSNFELGPPGVVGGGVNDLVAVTGNLTLAGTLNVAGLSGFGTGVYRLFTYGGALTDNTMTIGTVPSGETAADLSIQTAGTGQVNLVVNGAGLLEFWDGTNTANNAIIGGGTGTWDTATTNWTVTDGSINSAWRTGFAVFEGAAGTVSLANNVTISGLQFVTGGYLITSGNGSTITAASGTILQAGTGVSGTIGVAIIGAGDVTKADPGTVILTAANTYAGGTTISGGILQIGNGGATGSIIGAVADSGVLAFDRSDSLTFAGNISGSGNLVQMGGGILTLSGTNAYSGTTLVSTGTLQAGSTTALSPNSAFTVSSVLDVNGNSNTIGSLAGNGTVTNNGVTPAILTSGNDGTSTIFSGTLTNGSSSLGLTKTGVGTLTLSGTNSYSGVTTVSAGTLRAGSTTALSSNSAFIVNSVLDLNGNSNVIGSLAGSGTVTNTGPSPAILTAGGDGTTTIFSGILANGGSSSLGANKTGIGTLILTGTNTYTGATNISGGTLQIGNGGATGSIVGAVTDSGVLTFDRSDSLSFAGAVSGTGNLVQMGGGTLTLTGANLYSGTTLVSAGTLQAGSTAALSPNSAFTVNSVLDLNSNSSVIGSLAGTGTVTNTGAAATLTAGDTLDTTFSGTLQNGPGVLALTKAGLGTFTLSGANTYSGATTVSVGTLRAGSTTALSASSDFTVNSILDLNGFSNAIGSLAGSGTITNNGAAAATLAEGGTNIASTTFSGTLQDGIGTLGLTKSGTGTLILSGSSVYSGLTDVQAGVLSVQGILSGSAVQVESGATLGGTGVIHGTVTITNAGVLSPGTNLPGTLTVDSLVLNSGSLSNFKLSTPGVAGGGVNDLVTVTGNLTLGGTLNITDLGGFGAGVYRLFNDGTLIDNGLTIGTLPGGVTREALSIVTTPAGQVNLVVNGTSLLEYWDGNDAPNNGTVGGGSGTWNTANTNWTILSGSSNSVWRQGFAVFQGPAGTVTLTANVTVAGLEFVTTGYQIISAGSTITAATGTILQADTGVSGIIGAGIVGAGDVTKTGPGTVILTAASTYTGATTIDGGILQLGGGGTTGTIAAASNVTIGAGGTLNFDWSNGQTFSNLIGGTGNLIQSGASTLTLTGANTFSGTTTIMAGGAIQLGNGGLSGIVNGAILDNGQLFLNRSNSFILAGAITGTGSLVQNGTGTAILTGNSTYSGGTTINQGTLQVGNGGTIGMIGIDVNVAGGATLAFDRSDNVVFGKVISGAGGLTQEGSGTLSLSGPNTYLGPTNITAGSSLQLGNGGTTGTIAVNSTITIGLGGVLAFDWTNTQTVANLIGGNGTVTQNGTGTTILTAANTYAGGTTINTGTLQLGNGGTSGSMPGNVLDNGVLAFDRSDAVNYNSTISGTGAVTQLGIGTLVISGINTYSGGTSALAGLLRIGNNSALGSGVLTINGGNIGDNGSGAALNNGLAVQRDFSFDVTSGQSLSFNGGVDLGGGTRIVTGGLSGSGALVLNGVISNGSGLDLEAANSATATVTMGGTQANTYAGNTTVGTGITLNLNKSADTTAVSGALVINAGGTVNVKAANQIAATSAVTANGSLVLNNANQAIDQLIGNGSVSSVGISTLAVNSGTFSGSLSSSGLSLTKASAGTLILTGANTYGGLTEVQGGLLSVRGNLSNSAVQVDNGATLGGTGTISGTLTVANGGTIAPGNSLGAAVSPGTLTVGSLALNSGSVLRFELGTAEIVGSGINDLIEVNGNLTLAGSLNIIDLGGFGPGVYRLLDYGGAFINNGLVIGTVPGGVTAAALSIQTVIPGQVNVVVNGASLLQYWDGNNAPGNGLIGGGNGTWDTTTQDWTVVDGSSNSAWKSGVAIFEGPAGTVSLTQNVTVAGIQFASDGYVINAAGGATITASSGTILSSGSAMSGTINAVIAGTAGITKSDLGTVILAADNTYTGITTVTGGRLQIGAGGTTGTILTDTTLSGGATLAFDRSNSVVFGNVISGAGGLEQMGTGTLRLSGINTYAGNTDITAGSLQLGNNDPSGSIASASNINIGASGTLVFAWSINQSFGNRMSGTGNLVQAGASTLTLTANNPFSGTATINAGSTLELGNGGAAGTLAGNILDNGQLILNRFDAGFELDQVISGTGTLIQQGTGTSILTAANTYSGGTIVNFGTLQLGNGGGSGMVATNIAVAGGATLAFDRSDSVVFGNVVSGAGGLNQLGTGTLRLSGTNTYTGATTITAGTLRLGNNDGSGSIAAASNVNIAASGTLNFNWSTDHTFANLVSGTGSLTQTGASVLTLTGVNTFSGTATIGAGATLQFGNGGTSGTLNGAIVNNGQLVLNRSDSLSLAGIMSGSGTLVQKGTGTVMLTATSTYSGLSDVQAGLLSVLGKLTSSPVQVDSGGKLGGTGTIQGSVTIESEGTLAPGNGGLGTLSVGSLALSSGSILAYELGTPGGTNDLVEVSGNLTLAGILNVTDAGGFSAGVYRLFDYGGTFINNGLTLGTLPGGITASALSIQTATLGQVNLVVSGSSLLQFWDGTDGPGNGTIGGGNGTWNTTTQNWTVADGSSNSAWKSGFAVFGATAGTVTLAEDVTVAGIQFASDGYVINATGGATITASIGTILRAGPGMSGTINAVIVGTSGISKTDLGTVILAADNTYTGITTVSGGTLQFGNGGTSGTIVTDANLFTSATLAFDRSDSVIFGNVVSGTGNLAQVGNGVLRLSGTNTYTGITSVTAGTLQLGNNDAFGSIATNSTINIGAGGTFALAWSNNQIFANLISGTGNLLDSGLSILTLTGNNTFSGTTTIGSGATVQLGNGLTSGTVNGAMVDNGQLVLNRSDSFTLPGAISGTGALTKIGTNTSILTGNSSYTGGTLLSAGILQIGNGNTTGMITGTVTTGTGTTVAFDRSDSALFDGVIQGPGSLTQIGTGILRLSGINSYTGTTNITAGTLQLGNNDTTGAIAASNVVIGTGGTLALAWSNDHVLANLISGSGNLSQSGASILTLTANNTLSGTTTIAAGSSLQLGNGGPSGLVAGPIVDNGQLLLNRFDSFTLAAQISGSGALVQNGTGTSILTANQTYTGMTTVSAGTLQIGNGGITGSIVGDVIDNATLAFNRSDNPIYVGAISGTGTVVKNGTGTLTVTGVSSLSGQVLVQSGVLRLTGSLGTATVDISSGATLAAGGGQVGGTVTVEDGGKLSSGNTAATITLQSLVMKGANSMLQYNLNTAGVIGSNVNDLINVTGDVTLTGKLNIINLGAFGNGVYRLINYGGALTDQGLILGTLPVGFSASDMLLQSSVAGEFNLVVNQGGFSMQFWDGPNPSNNGVIGGGTGIWDTATINWTNATGIANSAWQSGTAVFGGTAGTVSLGQDIAFVGLQFTTGGYVIDSPSGFVLNPSGIATVLVDPGLTATIAAPISGTGGMQKLESGTLILSGTNTYSGATTISAGTLQLGNGGTSGSIVTDASVAGGATLAFDRSDSVIFGNVVSGAGGLSQLGTGTLRLSVINTYTGATIITAGTLQLGNSDTTGAIAASNVAIGANGTLNFDWSNGHAVANLISGTGNLKQSGASVLTLTGANTFSGTTTIAALGAIQLGNGGASGTLAGPMIDNGSLILNRSDTGPGGLVLVGAISGTGTFVQTGTGTSILTGTNTYSGGTTISAGTLQLGNATATGSISGNITDNGVLEFNRTDAGLIVGGNISGTGSVIQAGSGTSTLSGTNTYSGVTTVSAGTLQAGSNGALSVLAAFTVNGVLNLNGFSNAIGSLAGSGTVTNNGALAATLSAGGDNTSTIFSGTLLDGPGTLALTKTGTGAFTLTGPNLYSGGTNFNGGILAVGNDNNLGSGALAFNGGTLEATGSISSSKAVTLSTGGGTFLTDPGTISTLRGTIGGAGPLTKSGTGTLILSGTSTYSAPTEVQGGLLSVRGTLSTSAVQVASGAALGGTGTLSGTVTVASGGILSPGNSPGTLTVGALVLNTGSLSNFELGTPGVVGGLTNDLVAVTGNLTLAGKLNIIDLGGFGAGVYRLFNYGGTLTNDVMTIGTVPGGVTPGALTIQTAIANQVNLVVNGASLLEFWDGTNAPNNGVVGGGTGTWDTTTSNWTVANGSTNSAWKQGFALFGGAAGTVTLGENVMFSGLQFVTDGYLITSGNGSTLTAATGTILEAGPGVSGTIGVAIIGTGDVTVNNLGTVILTAANTYTGGTTISSGILQLGNGDASGSISGAINDNGSLSLDRSDAGLVLDGVISGTGTLVQMGTGTSILTGANTYTGGTTISAGTLQLGNAGATGSITR